MRIELLLRRRQAAAEKLMWGGCVASRPGEPFTDADGVVVTPSVEVYAGKFKIQTTLAQSKSPESGGHAFTVENVELHFPMSATLRADDTVKAVSHKYDQDAVGLTYRVIDLARGDQRTARRWNAELVTA